MEVPRALPKQYVLGSDHTNNALSKLPQLDKARSLERRTDIFRSVKDAPPRSEQEPVPDAEADLRTMQLDFDPAKERHRSIDSRVPDWPIDAAPTECPIFFLQQHTDWVSRSRIRQGHRALCEHTLRSAMAR